jgi:hypothetical protein
LRLCYIKIRLSFIVLTVFIFNTFSFIKASALQNPVDVDNNVLKTEIERIYNILSSCLVSGDFEQLKEQFDTSQKLGKYALEHEIKRVKYLKNWSKERGIKFKNIESFIRIKKVTPKDNIIRISLEESYKFDYIYEGDEDPVINSFGVGIRHTAAVTKKNDKWLIYFDWYTDCFEDALQAYTADTQDTISSSNIYFPAFLNLFTSSNSKINYDRQKAVAYADKYCGAAWGSGNDFK